jgi:hypothetical protein
MTRPSSAWKDLERRVAAALGGRRTGPAGAAVSDVVGTPWSVEVKRSKRGAILTAWLEQARSQGRREGRPWLLVVARHNDRAPTVTLEFGEFLSLAQAAGRVPGEARSRPALQLLISEGGDDA